jgi:type III secretory pathway component EscS
MAFCVGVASNKAIILIFLYSNCEIQVSTLEIRIKLYLIFSCLFNTLVSFESSCL